MVKNSNSENFMTHLAYFKLPMFVFVVCSFVNLCLGNNIYSCLPLLKLINFNFQFFCMISIIKCRLALFKANRYLLWFIVNLMSHIMCLRNLAFHCFIVIWLASLKINESYFIDRNSIRVFYGAYDCGIYSIYVVGHMFVASQVHS